MDIPLLSVYRGLVKWYDRSLQNFWWGFDSLIPCFLKTLESLEKGFRTFFILQKQKQYSYVAILSELFYNKIKE